MNSQRNAVEQHRAPSRECDARLYTLPHRGNGGTGRRAGFRFPWGDPWGFESPFPHHDDSRAEPIGAERVGAGDALPAAQLALAFLVPVQTDPPGSYVARFERAWGAFRAGRLDDATASYGACLELAPENPIVAFHLACTNARGLEHGEALEWLARAAEWGYADPEVAAWCEALAPLRERDAFGSVLARMEENAAALDDDPPRDVSLGRVPTRYRRARSADGTRLVLGDVLWDAVRAEPVAVLRRGDSSVGRAAFDPSGRWIATTSADAFCIWDAETGELEKQLHGAGTSTGRPSFDARDSRVACVVSDAPLGAGARVWSVPDGERLFFGMGSSEAFLDASGERLATVDGGHLYVWNVDTQRVIARFRGTARVRLVTTGAFYNVFCHDAESLEQLWRVDFGGGNPAPLSIEQDGAGARLTVSYEPVVLALEDGRILAEGVECGMRFTPADRFLIGGDGWASAVVRDGASHAELFERTEYAGGAWLASTPSLHVAGDVAAAEDRYLSVGGEPFPLRAHAARLLDPIHVAAWAAGIRSRTPRLPPVPIARRVSPRADAITAAGDAVTVTIQADCPDGVLDFEVVLGGELLPIEHPAKEVERHATGALLELTVPRPAGADDVLLLVRPISGAGVVGRAVSLAVRWP